MGGLIKRFIKSKIGKRLEDSCYLQRAGEQDDFGKTIKWRQKAGGWKGVELDLTKKLFDEKGMISKMLRGNTNIQLKLATMAIGQRGNEHFQYVFFPVRSNSKKLFLDEEFSE